MTTAGETFTSITAGGHLVSRLGAPEPLPISATTVLSGYLTFFGLPSQTIGSGANRARTMNFSMGASTSASWRIRTRNNPPGSAKQTQAPVPNVQWIGGSSATVHVSLVYGLYMEAVGGGTFDGDTVLRLANPVTPVFTVTLPTTDETTVWLTGAEEGEYVISNNQTARLLVDLPTVTGGTGAIILRVAPSGTYPSPTTLTLTATP
jgi:hypothetical protein